MGVPDPEAELFEAGVPMADTEAGPVLAGAEPLKGIVVNWFAEAVDGGCKRVPAE